MAVRDLIPRKAGRRGGLIRREQDDPFRSLHRQMDRLFDDFLHGFDLSPWAGERWPTMSRGYAPQIDVTENDTEVTVTAELPGMGKGHRRLPRPRQPDPEGGEARGEGVAGARLLPQRAFLRQLRAHHPAAVRGAGRQGLRHLQEGRTDHLPAEEPGGSARGEAHRGQDRLAGGAAYHVGAG